VGVGVGFGRWGEGAQCVHMWVNVKKIK
jgi:hypothetical protein